MKYLCFAKRALSLLFLLLISFGFDLPYLAVLTLISAFIHEMGHLIMIRLIRGEMPSAPNAMLSGFRIEVKRHLSYKSELLVCLAGPFVNVTVFFVTLPFYFSEYIFVFGIINLMSALTNLLPIEGYDGYKILSSILYNSPLEKHACSILFFLSIFFSAGLTFLSLYFLTKIGEGYWMFAIFFTSLLATLRKTTIFENS